MSGNPSKTYKFYFTGNKFYHSALTTTLMDATNNMPSCSYSIRLKALDGPKASVVKVGDTVVHTFKCDERGCYKKNDILYLSLYCRWIFS